MKINASRTAEKGFTLAELLIALGILGVIATFTIPKILTSSASSQATAVAKEAASMVSAAFTNYSLQNGVSTSVTGGALTQYMNYVSVDTATSYTATTGALPQCTATLPCLKLHNGGVLQYDTVQTFGGTTTTDSISFLVDPDGNGTQGRAELVQFANGRMTSGANAGTVRHGSAGTIATQATDPTYIANWN